MRVGDTRKEFVVCCMDAGDAGKGEWHARLRQFQNAKKP